jgi:predicted AAA+ superfamily ATPase
MSYDEYLRIDNLIPTKKKQNKINHPIGDPPFSLLVIGPSRSGKTNVILNLLVKWYSKAFDDIYLFSESAYEPSSGWMLMMERGIVDPKNVIDSHKLLDKGIEAIIEKQKADTSKENHVLVILDDIAKEAKSSKNLESLYSRGRHFRISTVVLSQKFKDVAPANRNNANSVILYRPQQTMELESIAEAFAGLMPKDEFKQMIKDVTKEKYAFLFVNQLEPDENKKFRKNFDTPIEVTI